MESNSLALLAVGSSWISALGNCRPKSYTCLKYDALCHERRDTWGHAQLVTISHRGSCEWLPHWRLLVQQSLRNPAPSALSDALSTLSLGWWIRRWTRMDLEPYWHGFPLLPQTDPNWTRAGSRCSIPTLLLSPQPEPYRHEKSVGLVSRWSCSLEWRERGICIGVFHPWLGPYPSKKGLPVLTPYNQHGLTSVSHFSHSRSCSSWSNTFETVVCSYWLDVLVALSSLDKFVQCRPSRDKATWRALSTSEVSCLPGNKPRIGCSVCESKSSGS